MKKILLALSLLIATPAFAATGYGTGNINDAFTATLVAVNDQICYNNVNLASKLATVQWTVVTAGSGGITVQISKDYGTNSIVGVPSSIRTDAASANPSTAPWANNTPVAGTYETPLPTGATNFCILYQTGGTATTITFAPGKPYAPGTLTATLYDVTEGSIGAGLNSGLLDVSGWSSIQIWLTTPTTQVWSFIAVDDAGANLPPLINTTAASSASMLLAPGAGGATGATLAASVSSSLSWKGKRIKLSLPAGGTVSTGRAVVVGSR